MDIPNIDITESEKNNFLRNIQLLNDYCDCAENLNEDHIIFLKEHLHELIGILPIKVNPTNSFSFPFQRFSINKTIKDGENLRLKSFEDLRYPRRTMAHKLDYNRASLKGQTIFYAGYGGLSVAVETQPNMGDVVTESKWRMKHGKSLNLLIICQDENIAMMDSNEVLRDYNEYLNDLRQLKENTRIVVAEVYKLIVKAFTRKVNPLQRQGYLMSALFTDLFFKHKSNPVDAIYYPSVANGGAPMNIAVKPDVLDEKFEMLEATEFFVTRVRGAWMNHPIARCRHYDEKTLELHWENCFLPDDTIALLIRFGINIKEFGIKI